MFLVWSISFFLLHTMCKTDQEVITVKPTEQQKIALRNVVTQLFDFDRTPLLAKRPPISRTTNAASKFMLKLYDEYQRTGSIDYQNDGNVVRSISPTIGHINGEEFLRYRLNTLKPSEHIIRAELHCKSRNKNRKSHEKFKELIGAQVVWSPTLFAKQKNFTHRLGVLSISKDSVIFNATASVLDAIHSNMSHLSIRFLHRGRSALPSITALRRFTPYLVVYSFKPMDNFYIGNESSHSEKPTGNGERVKRSSGGYYSYSYGESQKGTQAKRFHQTPVYLEEFLKRGPPITRRRKIRRENHRPKKLTDAFDPWYGFGKKKSRSKLAKRVTDQIQFNKLVYIPLDEIDSVVNHTRCRLYNLTISFKELGFKDVVQPESFSSNYCGGSCIVHREQDVDVTNHAIIQERLYLLNRDNLPPPCCAPNKLSGITVLYFTSYNDVALHRYNEVTVDSCACF
ncbi:hypothetical protein AB6A40_003223 [Gnathostoma spinigerum]|uniref:TGF-beta family profile domain-containing protein n=1 Tax=Gnathostoma spinigerum TaxID=75299 RepID=A0ABD6E8Y3_9BILA